jgi:ribosomal protein L37AE/L43A
MKTKTNCPYCNSQKSPDAGIWDFFCCGTDVDKTGKTRQSFKCVSLQRDKLLEKVAELEDKLNLLKKCESSKS